MDKETIRFIDRIYKDLYKSDQVLKHSTGPETDKFRNLEEYFETLERVHSKAAQSEERIKTLKRMYYDKYVIKPKDIPVSYYELQRKIALERGYGHINLTNGQIKELQEEVIGNQKSSLDKWLDYFLSNDSKFYPFWLKYWAFQGMLKLGLYDKEKGSFNKRGSDTVAPFPDLNREALSISMDLILKVLNKEKIEDRELDMIVKSGSFQKIYPYVLKNVLSNNMNITKKDDGKWIKYDQGNNYMPLVKSLQGYNTGWCTAGENTAKSQLQMGDFYVYYTLDENGEYKVPRIAIRMEGNKIGEIRGIARDQNLEPGMEKIVEEKIQDFPDKDAYHKKVEDMKKLTEIYKKTNNGEDLSIEELRFIYEIDSEIIGFGWQRDPRIKEIIDQRNVKKDLSLVLDCDESKISLTGEPYSEETEYYYGDIVISNITNEEELKLPKRVRGDLILNDVKNPKKLKLPEFIGRDLRMNGFETIEDFKFPRFVGGSISLYEVVEMKNIILPEYIGRDLIMESLRQAENMTMPKYVGRTVSMPNLERAPGLVIDSSIGDELIIHRLKDADGLVLPTNVGGDAHIYEIANLKNIVIPESFNYKIFTGQNIYVNSDYINDYLDSMRKKNSGLAK